MAPAGNQLDGVTSSGLMLPALDEMIQPLFMLDDSYSMHQIVIMLTRREITSHPLAARVKRTTGG